MSVKLDQVLARVASKDAIAHCASLDNERLRVLVIETLASVGLEVARDGEVYDPAPIVNPASCNQVLTERVRFISCLYRHVHNRYCVCVQT